MNSAMAKLYTLTVPDMLWVNLQVTKDTQQYSFARLEEAVFCQYGYGGSDDVLGQAAQFLTGFRRLRPFTHGNAACAFIGMVVFLEMNGFALDFPESEAVAWATEAWADESAVTAKIAAATHPHDAEIHDDIPSAREIAEQVLAKYREAIQTLNSEEPVVALL